MRAYINKNYIHIITIILGINLITFLFAYQNLLVAKQDSNDRIAHAQETLICPTDTTAQKTLQLLSCYINTPTPTVPVSPTPTVTPAPTSQPKITPSPTVDTSCKPQSSDYLTIKQALSDKFKINLTGDQSAVWASEAYTTMCQLNKSSMFMSLLTSQGPVTVNFSGIDCANVSGHADMNAGITISGMCDPALNRAVLVHEFGHMIAFRNPAIFNNFLSTIWPATIPTFNCMIHNLEGVTAPECFADAVGEYLVYMNYRIAFSGQPPGNTNFAEYPTTYANYYNFIKTNLFGGITYTTF